jgi:hypothetical protein
MDATTPALITRVADQIDRVGVELLSCDLMSEFVAAARATSASPVLVDVFVDPTEPAVARERAAVLLTARILGGSGRRATGSETTAPQVVLAA